MSKKFYGHEEIERCNRYIGWLNLSFVQEFTAEELLKIWRYAAGNKDIPEMADEWDDKMLAAALAGK